MKINLLYVLVFISIGCISKQGFKVADGFWGEVIESEANLYSEATINGDIKKVLMPGSIVFIGEQNSDVTEVYTYDPRKDRDESYRATYRFYVKDLKVRRTTYRANSVGAAKIVELPYDNLKNYIRGERGGCYYINSNGNRTYVPRSYCSGAPIKNSTKKRTYSNPSSSYSSTCGARTKSGGFCKRKVKGGGRCYQH